MYKPHEVQPDHPENWPRKVARDHPDLLSALEKIMGMIDEGNAPFAWPEFISEREAMARQNGVNVHLIHRDGGRYLSFWMPHAPRRGDVIDLDPHREAYAGVVESVTWRSGDLVEVRLLGWRQGSESA